jgi:hypothetical protein
MVRSKDRFGYYTVNGTKTYSKVEAIELHKLTGHHPHWNFNEDVFSMYNWQIEPTKSLEQLYAERAWNIRNHYDYVVLCYSGGADSDNILDTFVRNQIPFDEILTFNYHELDSSTDNNFHAEQFRVSYPKINQLKQQGLVFKHRAFDLSNLAFNILTTDYLESDIAYYQNHSFGASHYARQRIREHDPELKKLIDSGKSVVFVWGAEKPRLFIDQGRYCVKFQDIVDFCCNTRSRILNHEWEHDELFYWDPSCCDLICKQAHTIMNFLKHHPVDVRFGKSLQEEKIYFMKDLQQKFNQSPTQALVGRQILDALIYPYWDPFTFTVGKSTTPILSPRDTPWYKDQVLSKKLKKCVQHLKSLDNYWHNDVNDISKGLKNQISPPYFLE